MCVRPRTHACCLLWTKTGYAILHHYFLNRLLIGSILGGRGRTGAVTREMDASDQRLVCACPCILYVVQHSRDRYTVLYYVCTALYSHHSTSAIRFRFLGAMGASSPTAMCGPARLHVHSHCLRSDSHVPCSTPSHLCTQPILSCIGWLVGVLIIATLSTRLQGRTPLWALIHGNHYYGVTT